jgi:hypothetical protein
MKRKLSLLKIAGAFSTAALITASLAPNFLHIPPPLRPWIFMLTTVWILLIASGVFS